jgi:mRNA interferase MazF
MISAQPNRGEVWFVNLDSVVGREPSGTRPGLVVSVDKLNHGPSGLVIVVPITSKDKHQPVHVPVKPPEGGLSSVSFIKCEDVRSISRLRLKQYRGTVSERTMAEVERLLRALMDL